MDNEKRDNRSKNSRNRNVSTGSIDSVKPISVSGENRKVGREGTEKKRNNAVDVDLNLNSTGSARAKVHSRNKSRGKVRKVIKKERFFAREDRWYLIATVYLLMRAAVLQVIARQIVEFGQWYTIHLYPVIVSIWGRFCGFLPFSVIEIGGYLTVLGLIVCGIYHREGTGRVISRTVFILGALAFIYTTNYGVGYYRRPFSSYLDLEVRGSSVEKLTSLCQYLMDKINETVDKTSMEKGWPREARECMVELREGYPELGGYYPVPKPLAISGILPVQQLCGVCAPFTVEANFNQEVTIYNIPHTMYHELSHLKGFMGEDEANFIGYLAYLKSDGRSFQYSGYLTGRVYATNALTKQDTDKYMELYRQLNEDTVRNLRESIRFWNQYDGKVAKVSNQMNDTYLKFNDQQNGVQSCGRMVGLVLAYCRESQ